MAELLNAIIARGGTTALEEPYSAESLADAYLVGSEVICCFAAVCSAVSAASASESVGNQIITSVTVREPAALLNSPSTPTAGAWLMGLADFSAKVSPGMSAGLISVAVRLVSEGAVPPEDEGDDGMVVDELDDDDE